MSDNTMLIEAIELVVNSGSAARFQRRMHVGFATASKLLYAMEDLGVVGPQPAKGARDVLVKPDAAAELVAGLRSQQAGRRRDAPLPPLVVQARRLAAPALDRRPCGSLLPGRPLRRSVVRLVRG